MGAMILSLVLNISKNLIFAISLYLYYGVFALVICSIVFLNNGIFIFNVSSNIFLTITCFLLGYCCDNHSEDFIWRCMKIFVLSALFLGLYSVHTNLGGFIISERYAFAVKNSSGVLLGTAIILCAFILNNSKGKIQTIIWVVNLILLSACLITFRSRTAIIIVLLCLFYFLYRKHLLGIFLQRPLIIIFFVAILILANILDFTLLDFIYNSLFANKDVNSLDSVTSGRLSTYEYGLQVFSESPMLGNAVLGRHLPPVDNFIIGHLTYYGIVGTILVFPPYLYTWYICLSGLLKNPISKLYPFLTLFLICMTSFTEGPYPFGPGTPVVCAWFLLGWSYKSNQLKISEESDYRILKKKVSENELQSLEERKRINN